MPKVLNPNTTEPTLINLEGMYLDTAERRMQEALHEVPPTHRRQASELCYLVYESMVRGKFGSTSSRYDVAITCNETEFVVSVKGG